MTSTSISLTWNANPSSQQVDRYQVYYQKPNWSGTTTTILNVAGTSYTITGLTAATSYGVRVSAHNSVGYGPWSDPPLVASTSGTAPTTATTTTTTTTTTTSSSSAPTATGRWYSSDSPWDTRIPVNPQLAANNGSMISTFATNAVVGVASSSVPSIGIAQTTTPNVTVVLNYPTCNYARYQVPIPAGTYIENTQESHLVVVAPDGTEWDMFKVTDPSHTPLSSGPICPAISGDWAATVIAVRGPTIGWQSKGDTGPSFRGSGICGGCGTIRKRDMQAANGSGPMDHAVAIAYPITANGSGEPCHVYPASTCDGTHSGTGTIPEGARLQLDPSINCDTWSSMVGQPAWKHTLCKTLQTYGAIVMDTGAGLPMEWYRDGGSDWVSGLNGFSWSSNKLPSDLYSHFRVLDWNWHWAGGNP